MNVRQKLGKLAEPRVLVHAIGVVLVIALGVWLLRSTLGGVFESSTTLGIHDWDTHTAHRYIPMLLMKRYHEGPWWSPWYCGGYAAWGYSESAPDVVSPFLPVYWLASLPVALRIEVVGTTVIALVGAWLFAAHHTRSVAVRALVAVLFALNGRWALQTASGHAWHMQYAYMPWALWFFERAVRGKMSNAFASGAVIALIAFAGGIYPLPHTALALVVYGVALAVSQRRLRPIGAVAVTGIWGLLLAAPKLLPVMDTMRRAPRTIDSIEFIDPRQLFLMLVEREQGFGRPPPNIGGLSYGWHEFGIYVGLAGAAVIAAGLLARGNPGSGPMRVTGVLFLILGFGAFHENAPWALLHKLPIFKSQHVPSRFLHPAVLFLSVAFASAFERRASRFLRVRPWLDLVLLLPVAWIAFDVGSVSKAILADAFTQVPPAITESKAFHHERYSPVNYPTPDWATPVYLATRSNVGAIECWAVPNDFPRGAIAQGAPEYKGEAYVVNGTGEATITSWTPNSATIEVKNASPGALVVYNMNWDPSWRANGAPALEYAHAVAAPTKNGNEVIELRYRPRTLPLGVALALFAMLTPFALSFWRRRRGSAELSRTPPAPPLEPPAPPPDPT
jgi:hypothetical protein